MMARVVNVGIVLIDAIPSLSGYVYGYQNMFVEAEPTRSNY
jgi:hypothetical protein